MSEICHLATIGFFAFALGRAAIVLAETVAEDLDLILAALRGEVGR